MQAGLAGDRTAFPSEIRFTKREEARADLSLEFHLLMMTQHSSLVGIRLLPP